MVETESRISIELPIEKEFARLLRLLVSGIASRMNFDLDAVDDLKIAVEEGYLLALRRQAPSPLKVSFTIGGGALKIEFADVGPARDGGGQSENFGNFILDAVVDDLQTVEADGQTGLQLIKYL